MINMLMKKIEEGVNFWEVYGRDRLVSKDWGMLWKGLGRKLMLEEAMEEKEESVKCRRKLGLRWLQKILKRELRMDKVMVCYKGESRGWWKPWKRMGKYQSLEEAIEEIKNGVKAKNCRQAKLDSKP